MRLGIYIGSFDPPHLGHLDVINYLLQNGYVDKILIVPTNSYWNKQNLTDITDRINMLRFYENEYISVDDKNNDYPYTFELMHALSTQYPYELYLIIGADNIINFDKWQNYEELLQYKIIVMNRNGINIDRYLEKYKTDNFIAVSDYSSIPISSTEIRNNPSSKYLHQKVLKYIKDHKLYEKK